MLPWWIPITLFAACMQVARTGLQKALTAELDYWSVTWIRSGFALPWAALYVWGLDAAGFAVPENVGGMFWLLCGATAAAQTVATVMLVALFSRRNFAVSTAFSKTEAPQIALFGFLLFGEQVSVLGAAAVVLGGAGVFIMTVGGGKSKSGTDSANDSQNNNNESQGAFRPLSSVLRLLSSATWLGLGAGFFFALTALFIRRAYGELDDAGPAESSALALLAVIGMQTAGLGLWLLLFRRDAFAKIWRARGRSALAGVTSVLGSAGWFAAFALAHPAYVKTLSQVELLLAWAVGRRAFRERMRGAELAGTALVAAGAIAAAFAE